MLLGLTCFWLLAGVLIYGLFRRRWSGNSAGGLLMLFNSVLLLICSKPDWTAFLSVPSWTVLEMSTMFVPMMALQVFFGNLLFEMRKN